MQSDHKRELMKYIASYLGWPDLRADTFPGERKFNIWYFHDPRSGERELHSRRVALRHPLDEKSFSAKIPAKRR